jgi:DNA-directed RNA polymerase specialized sigma24 family protein
MGLFIAAGTASDTDAGVQTVGLQDRYSELLNDSTESNARVNAISADSLEALRKHQTDVIEILNIGEAINSRDFLERCAEDKFLTSLSFEASERMLQEVEVQDFVSSLPSDLAELVNMLDEGLKPREIAKIKGLAKGTIQYRIEKLRSITRAYLASAVAA